MTYGLRLKDALALPCWEFKAKVDYARKHQARQSLELYQVVSVGSWGDKESRKEYLKEMRIRAGYGMDKPKIDLPTQDELRTRVDRFFAVSGVNIPIAGG